MNFCNQACSFVGSGIGGMDCGGADDSAANRTVDVQNNVTARTEVWIVFMSIFGLWGGI
jgi:hypothetical protein